MKILFKYLVIFLWIISLSQPGLFAQFNDNYENKYVQIFLKNERSLDGKVIHQTEEKITLEIYGGEVSFYKEDIERIDIKEYEEQGEHEEQGNPPLTSGHSSYKSSGSGNQTITSGSKTIAVKGYYRKDGTYVPPYRRSAPNSKK